MNVLDYRSSNPWCQSVKEEDQTETKVASTVTKAGSPAFPENARKSVGLPSCAQRLQGVRHGALEGSPASACLYSPGLVLVRKHSFFLRGEISALGVSQH